MFIGKAVLGFLFPLAQAFIDFNGIPAAHTLQESKDTFELRKSAVIRQVSSRTLEPFSHNNGLGFHHTGLAFLAADYKEGIQQLDRFLADPKAVPYAKVGTDIKIISKVCERKGDYDFALHGLVRLAYEDKGRLSLAAREHLLGVLLTEKGDKHHTHFWLGICGRYKDSENHILMIESSRYLTNQLIKNGYAPFPWKSEYDNFKNDFPKWFANHLQSLFVKGFEEYNARPYQAYTVHALNNLYAYAQDPEVKLGAQILLDQLAAVFSTQSNGLRRSPPWRRQPRYADITKIAEGDGEIDRFMLLAGNFHYLSALPAPDTGKYEGGDAEMLSAAVEGVQVPDLLLGMIVEPAQKTYFQRYRHKGAEVYSSIPEALISSGGTYVRDAGPIGLFSDERDGHARPTTLFLSNGREWDLRQLLRLEGHKDKKKRNNLCVAPGFACGLSLRIPDYLPPARRQKIGTWEFLDLGSPNKGPYNYGVYVATWRQTTQGQKKACAKAADNYGLFEVRSAHGLGFDQFRASVLNANPPGWNCKGTNTYVTSKGQRVEFHFLPESMHEYPILSIGGVAQQTDYRRWPRALGDIANSNLEGTLWNIVNPSMNQRLVLDYRDPMHPQRILGPWRP